MHRLYNIEKNPTITMLCTVFEQTLNPDFKFHGETHDFWELVCVTKGEIYIAADHRIFNLKQGQAILHNPMQFHNIANLSGKEAKIAVFSFNGKNVPPLQNKVWEITSTKKVEELLKLAKKSFELDFIYVTKPKQNGLYYLRFVKELELFLLNLSDSSVNFSRQKSQGAENYSVIIKTLNEHIAERLTVCEIARICNMSEIGLQKTFSKFAGMGVMEYFNRLKCNRAQVLLKEGLTVKETSLSLGFCDQNYFSTVFKRIMGKSPKEAK